MIEGNELPFYAGELPVVVEITDSSGLMVTSLLPAPARQQVCLQITPPDSGFPPGTRQCFVGGRCPEVIPKACVPAGLVPLDAGCDLPVNSPAVQQMLMSNRRVTPSTSSSPKPDETILWDSSLSLPVVVANHTRSVVWQYLA